jgi:hypothetical protein
MLPANISTTQTTHGSRPHIRRLLILNESLLKNDVLPIHTPALHYALRLLSSRKDHEIMRETATKEGARDRYKKRACRAL